MIDKVSSVLQSSINVNLQIFFLNYQSKILKNLLNLLTYRNKTTYLFTHIWILLRNYFYV